MIKLFHSGMVGAPDILNNTAGTLITVLDACLVNGWGSATVDSIVVTSGIATVTLAGHPFEADTVSLIAGATVSGGSINGEQKVLTVTATTYTFDATGISNQTATGTITHVLPSLGFEKVYSGTNLAAYRSPTGIRHYLRIDDTGTVTAKGVAYESMSDINTGINRYPASGSTWDGIGNNYLAKSDSSTNRPWLIVGDDKAFTMRPRPYGNVNGVVTTIFGEFKSTVPSDPYASCFISGYLPTLNNYTDGSHDTTYINGYNANSNEVFARSWNGVRVSVPIFKNFNALTDNNLTSQKYAGDLTGNLRYPNAPNNALYVMPWCMYEIASSVYRGELPGFYATPQTVGVTAFLDMERITQAIGLPTDRRLLAVIIGRGTCFIDLTGPWR